MITALNKSADDDLVSHLPDADMQAAPRALLRAAQRAREIAERTGTKLVVHDDTAASTGWPGGVSPPLPEEGAGTPAFRYERR
jgi:hypothetical protein